MPRPNEPSYAHAALAGLAGGLAFGLVIDLAMGEMAAIGALVGAPGAGWLVHLAFSATFGVAFAALLRFSGLHIPTTMPPTDRSWPVLAAGLAWGAGLWLVAAGVVMPVWQQQMGLASPGVPNLAVLSLAGHLVYGIVLAGGLLVLADPHPTRPGADAVAGGLAVVLVVAAVVPAASAPTGTAGAPTTFEVTWTTEDHELDAATRTVGLQGGEASFAFDVSRRNLTAARFHVIVTVPASHVGSDDVTATVEGPDGSTDEARASIDPGGSRAELDLNVSLAEVPDVDTVRANSTDEARHVLAMRYTATTGIGSWNLTVSIDHTGAGGDHDIEARPTLADWHVEVR